MKVWVCGFSISTIASGKHKNSGIENAYIVGEGRDYVYGGDL